VNLGSVMSPTALLFKGDALCPLCRTAGGLDSTAAKHRLHNLCLLTCIGRTWKKSRKDEQVKSFQMTDIVRVSLEDWLMVYL
jgi:hypothetical protein